MQTNRCCQCSNDDPCISFILLSDIEGICMCGHLKKTHALLHPDRLSSSSTPLTTPQTSRTVTSQIANAIGAYSPGSNAATSPSTTITQNQMLFTQETSFSPSQLAYLLSQVTTPRRVISKLKTIMYYR
ncbi:unnamed protein product [Didymodactylos carnosus]|uniref:Uncharacterized protein n=1 Tax=Didymodactylos carnosus TaxID=1234261 RepID=A0A8S2IBX5_9BILA|nr:unnamed protein product [Didymodactylos carnosus]CAF3739847.1 unnamed protein product [Didymodactylos carnosus]